MKYLFNVIVFFTALGSGAAVTPTNFTTNGDVATRQLVDAPFFSPLTCNAALTDECLDWEEFALDLSSRTVVPCGVCVEVGCDVREINAVGGIDVQGRLVFKDYLQDCPAESTGVTVTTPFLHVQGELVMRSSRRTSGGEPDVKMVLTGTTQHPLLPHSENARECHEDGCFLGKKAIIVAGGTLDIQGLPAGCETWAKLAGVQTETLPGSFAPEGPPSLPESCSAPIVIFHDFENQAANGWNSHYSKGGFEVRSDESGSSHYFAALGRTATWQGPMIDIRDHLDCILPNVEYYITAKLRLLNPDGVPSNCQEAGESCVHATLYSEDIDPAGGSNKKSWSTKAWGPSSRYGPKATVLDDEWFYILGVATFTEAEASSENAVARRLYFNGPEAGVDLFIDDFSLSLQPPSQLQPDSAAPFCQNLVPFNGDGSSSFGAYSYPFQSNDWRTSLEVKDEVLSDGSVNTYFSTEDRQIYYSSLEYDLSTGCITRGSWYNLSIKLRVHSEEPAEVRVLRYREVNGEKKSWTSIADCGKQVLADGWVTCTGKIIFTKDDEEATSYRIYFETERDSSLPDIDFDDFSIDFQSGPATGLLVQSAGIDTCWGDSSELLITSPTLNWDDSTTVTLDKVTIQDGTSALLELKAPFLPADLSLSSDEEYGVEVALLSRNIRFESADDDSNELHGGHLMILKTPSVAQTIEGLEVRRFGQQMNLGRYPIHFHMSDSVPGSVVSKNLVRESLQRCIVIHGSHNVTVSKNIAFDTQGHCFMLEDGGEMDNTFEYNLGALTKPAQKIRSEETDDRPSTFWFTNPVNTFRGNVAAGSSDSGFWFEMRTSVRMPTGLYQDFNPSKLPLRLFEDNVAHSNHGHGVKTYPGAGYNPPTRGMATFQNTKSFRNRGAGFFIHNSRNIHIEGGTYADNRRQIDIDRAPGCSVNGASLVGYSQEYENIVQTSKARSHCPSEYPLVGVQLHTYWSGGVKNLGSDISNVRFERLGSSTGCTGTAAINVEHYENKGYFDVRSSMEGLSFDEETDPIDLCESSDAGIDFTAIQDKDGSVSGEHGFIVSDSPRMTSLWPEGTCTSLPGTCAASCKNTCYRTWSAAVSNFEDDDLELVVKDLNSGKSISVLGTYEPRLIDGEIDVSENSRVWHSRRFFATIPEGESYTAEFRLNGEPHWPVYVEHQFDDDPGACGGDFGSFTLLSPEPDCSQLIKNGSFDNGIADWWTTGGSLEAATGVEGEALMNGKRTSDWNAVAQFIDSRCLEQGQEYTLTAQVKMQSDSSGAAFSCADDQDKCPRAYMRANQGIDPEYNTKTEFLGGLQGSWQAGEWNKIETTFTVTEEQANSHAAFLYFTGAPSGVAVVLDDVSLVPKKEEEKPTCGDSVVVNHAFDGGSFLGWDGGGAAYEVTSSDSHTLSDPYFLGKERKSTWQGPRLELTTTCVQAYQTYKITAKMRLTKDSGISDCAAAIGSGDVSKCISLRWTSQDIDPSTGEKTNTYRHLGQSKPSPDGEWIDFVAHVTFTANDVKQTEDVDIRRLYFGGPEAGVDIAMDDFQMELAPCSSESVIDYNFDNMDSFDGWSGNGGGYQIVSGSDPHFLTAGRTSRGHGPMIELPVHCLLADGTPYDIEAKVMTKKSGDDQSPSDCQLHGKNCIELRLYSEDWDGRKNWATMGSTGQHTDGNWFEFDSVVNWSMEDVNVTSAKYRRLYFWGPEAGVDIALDHINISPVVAEAP